MEKMKDKSWSNIWQRSFDQYGEVLYKRATGELPEMESAKALVKVIGGKLNKKTRVLDIGCGAGHYLRTLRQAYGTDFHYTGIDATENYIGYAKKAWRNDPQTEFKVGSVFKLPVKAESYDLVICCNLLLHLADAKKPLLELIKATKSCLIVRTLISDRMFIVKEMLEKKSKNSSLEDLEYNYFNVYSERYFNAIIKDSKRKTKKITFSDDKDFNAKAINKDVKIHKRGNGTEVINGMQVNGAIICPWKFLKITF
ncbi:MAG: class I SAM-dependent methyltransferase [Verrucomicrobiota bacterium]